MVLRAAADRQDDDAHRATAAVDLLTSHGAAWPGDGPATTESNRFREQLLEAVHHPVIAVDRQRVVIYWNAAAEELFGWTAAEALGRRSTELLKRDETEDQTEAIIDAMRRGASWSGDVKVERRSGGTVSVRVTNQPVFNADGELLSVIGTCIDLTAHEEQEEASNLDVARALSVAEARYDAIVEYSSDVIMLFRPDFTIEWASPGTVRLFNVEASELIGRSGLDLIHPDDVDQCFQDYLSVPNLGDHVRSEFRYIDPNGELHWIEEISTNLLDDPRVGFTVGSLRDITERKQMVDDLELQARLLQAVGQAVVAADTDLRIVFWNEAATDLYGWTRAEAVGQPIADILVPSPGWMERADEVMASILEDREWSGTLCIDRKDGTPVTVLGMNTMVYDRAGAPIAWIGVSSDQSERLELEATQAALHTQVEDDRRRMHDAQRSAQLGSFEFDTATGARSWSDELFRILGMERTEIPAMDDVVEHVHPEDRPEYNRFREDFLVPGTRAGCTVRIVRPDGTMRWAEIAASPHHPGSTTVSGTVLDVTDRTVAQAELVHRAHHDPLTDLPNRTRISEVLERALTRQGDTEDPVAVAFLDLDHFKVINDSLGHSVGDQILQSVADRLQGAAAATDVVGRFGGDEFIVVRERCAGRDEALQLADQLRDALDAPVVVDGLEFTLVASVGVALSRPHDTPLTILRDADTAMYHAKERGRNRAEVFDEALRSRTEDRLTVALELRAALENEELRLVYQPIVTLSGPEAVGFEALIRWDHPVRGELSPDAFIGVAEETSLIIAIGRWVLEQGLTQLAAWRAADPTCAHLFLSVNVSAKELSHPGLVAATTAVLAASDVPPDRIHLEITESAVMENVEHSIATAHALRDLGLHLSIDDFGTGYSSLSYLKQLPVTTLKIDQSFVSGLEGDLQDRSIVQAIISLADALNLEVVAEGVETAAQRDTLVELGCKLGQGYLWSKPVTPAEAVAFGRVEGSA